jgi:hypothetical protein
MLKQTQQQQQQRIYADKSAESASNGFVAVGC